MRAIYIDTSSKNKNPVVVFVTQIGKGRIVIREAVHLPKYSNRSDLYDTDLVIIDATGYKSTASGGYVEVVSWHDPTHEIVGVLPISGGLRPIPPKNVYVLKNAKRHEIPTHKTKNKEVAFAARNYLVNIFRKDNVSDMKYGDTVLIIEGTAISTKAVYFEGKYSGNIEFPEEYQKSIINPTTIATAKAIDDFFLSYYYNNCESTKEKRERLAAESIAIILGTKKNTVLKVNAEIAFEIAKKYVKVDDFHTIFQKSIKYFPDEKQEEIYSKQEEIYDKLFPFLLVEAVYDGDHRRYTWAAPVQLKIYPGDRVIVDTAFGEEAVTVVNVKRSTTDGGHRRIIEKV